MEQMKSAINQTIRISFIFLFLFLGFFSISPAAAASVSLAWNPVQPAPDGYRLFVRQTNQAYDYGRPTWEGTGSNATINNLQDQTEYYIVVRAFDGNLESGNSNEVRYVVPAPENTASKPPNSTGSDTTPPYWDGASPGIGLAKDVSTGGRVTVEFDTARDAVDGRNLKFNVYYATRTSWNNYDWSSNNIVYDATLRPGNTFAHAVTIDGLTNGIRYTFGVRVEDHSGNEDTNTNTLRATPTKQTNVSNTPSSGSGFTQDSTANGLLVMRAENYTANIDQGSHGWVWVNRHGVSAMQALPDSGARIASNYVSKSPYLQFKVNFVKTGTHYIWLRGHATGNDNSAHVGLNGKATLSSENVTLPVNQGWVWSGSAAGGQRATINVSQTGVHTVEVWMREDGLLLDQVLFTTSARYTPSNAGPPESAQK